MLVDLGFLEVKTPWKGGCGKRGRRRVLREGAGSKGGELWTDLPVDICCVLDTAAEGQSLGGRDLGSGKRADGTVPAAIAG